MVQYLPSGDEAAHLYDLIADYPLRPSKMLRSVLCIATCRLFGGSAEEALDCAVSLELLHNAFMIHDDVEDESMVRRGRPTLHETHGVPLAINAGDALGFLSLMPLLDRTVRRPHSVTGQMIREIVEAVAMTVEGQATEIAWIREGVLDLDDYDYYAMVFRKTCCYTGILPCRLGELAARGRLSGDWHVSFGAFLGSAFQVRDDVLNLDASFDAYGKEIGGDVIEGKRTLMLLHLMRTCSRNDREHLSHIYRLPKLERTEEHVLWVTERMRSYGSLDYAISAANGLAGAALAALGPVLEEAEPSDDSLFLRALVVELVTRVR
jgi:geranylgeranyl diphosphate synthase type II